MTDGATRDRARIGWASLTLLLTLALLAPALWNGFPLVFADSGEYLAWAWQVVEPRYRTLGYAAWLRAFAVGGTVWPVVIAQALWAATVLLLAWRAATTRGGLAAFALTSAVLALGTALGFGASQLMPDVFSGLVAVAAWLAVSAWPRLSRAPRALVITTLVVGGAMHVTHLAIGLGVAAVVGHLVRLRRGWQAAFEGTGRTVGALAGGAALAIALSGAFTGRAVLSRNGHVFVLAHLVDAGIAKRLLAEHCDTRAYALCPYRAALDTLDGESFVWRRESPFQAIGGWNMDPAEPRRMLRDAWADHPGAMAAQAVALSASQFMAIGTGDALTVGHHELLDLAFARLLPADHARYDGARQQQGTLDVRAFVSLHAAVAVMAWLAGVVLLVLALWRPVGPSSELVAAAWAALLVNAVVCANFAVVRDRYQARLLWILPFALLADILARWSAQQAPRLPQHAGPDASGGAHE